MASSSSSSGGGGGCYERANERMTPMNERKKERMGWSTERMMVGRMLERTRARGGGVGGLYSQWYSVCE